MMVNASVVSLAIFLSSSFSCRRFRHEREIGQVSEKKTASAAVPPQSKNGSSI
jgi:hypothetical protein